MNSFFEQGSRERAVLEPCGIHLTKRGYTLQGSAVDGWVARQDGSEIEIRPIKSSRPSRGYVVDIELNQVACDQSRVLIEKEQGDDDSSSVSYILRKLHPSKNGGLEDSSNLHQIFPAVEDALDAAIQCLS